MFHVERNHLYVLGREFVYIHNEHSSFFGCILNAARDRDFREMFNFGYHGNGNDRGIQLLNVGLLGRGEIEDQRLLLTTIYVEVQKLRREYAMSQASRTTYRFAQFFYWADIVKELNTRLVEDSGHRRIDQKEGSAFFTGIRAPTSFLTTRDGAPFPASPSPAGPCRLVL